MSVDFIFDIETLGKTDGCVLLSFGILPCPEDLTKEYSIEELTNSGLYVKLNREEQIKYGRSVEQETVDWWSKQDKAARLVLSNDNLTDNVFAYFMVRKFMFDNGLDKNSKIWSRGMIDQRWWQSWNMSCQKMNSDVVDFLGFWLWRDIRTALELMTGNPNGNISINDVSKNIIKHNALSDCILDFYRFQEAVNNV